jgi:hypothetical protein
MKLIASCVLFTVLLIPLAHADPPVCKKWINYMDACDGVVASPACSQDQSTWSEGQRRNYNNWNFTSSADNNVGPAKACRKLIRKHITENPNQAIKCPVDGPDGPKLFKLVTHEVATPPFTDDAYLCTCDRGGPMGDHITTEADLSSDSFQINLETITPEPVCYATPCGPYSDVAAPAPGPGSPPQLPPYTWPRGRSGGRFSTTMKSAVLKANAGPHATTATSDLHGACGQFDPYSQLAVNDNVLANDDDPDPRDPEDPIVLQPPLQIIPPAAVQIDHIIPRIDIQGCECGTNGIENTLVLSAGLNGQTSNLLEHEARQAILHRWTNYTPEAPPNPPTQDVCAGNTDRLCPGVPFELDTSEASVGDGEVQKDLDGGTDRAADDGGCSTTSSNGALLGLAVLLVPRRRKRL